MRPRRRCAPPCSPPTMSRWVNTVPVNLAHEEHNEPLLLKFAGKVGQGPVHCRHCLWPHRQLGKGLHVSCVVAFHRKDGFGDGKRATNELPRRPSAGCLQSCMCDISPVSLEEIAL